VSGINASTNLGAIISSAETSGSYVRINYRIVHLLVLNELFTSSSYFRCRTVG